MESKLILVRFVAQVRNLMVGNIYFKENIFNSLIEDNQAIFV